MYIIKNNEEIVLENLNNIKYSDRERIYFSCEECLRDTSVVYRSKDQFIDGFLCRHCRKKKTNLKKYNDENYVNKEKIKQSLLNLSDAEKTKIQEKIKKTKLKKYGFEFYTNSEKAKRTMVERYGVKTGFQTTSNREALRKQETIDKRLDTFRKNNPKQIKQNNLSSNELRKKTKLKKYNDPNYNNRKKAIQTNLKKYGVEHVMKRDLFKEKTKNSQFKKYGMYAFNTEKQKITKLKNFYDRLITSDRLKELVEPLFSMDDYIGGKEKKYLWKCKKCNNIFLDYICDGLIPRCTNCFPINSSYSRLEKEIANWLKFLNIEIIENDRDIISPLELDIYIPSHDLAIEFNGLYWHSELQGKDSSYHLNKTNKCLKKGVQLLHIWEDEWIEKQEIVKSIIKSKLGLYDSIIHGRKCSVSHISNKEASSFYFENHIQGNINSSINLGLYHNNELVSCLSFSKPRFNKKYDWEITRFANKLNYKIHGGFSKLWNHRPEGSIITYSDKRLFTGSIYKKYLKQLPDSKSSYWYIKNGQIHNRLEFQKHKLSKLEIYDKNLTEWENMQLNGYDRIWDCGNHVFESFTSFSSYNF